MLWPFGNLYALRLDLRYGLLRKGGMVFPVGDKTLFYLHLRRHFTHTKLAGFEVTADSPILCVLRGSA